MLRKGRERVQLGAIGMCWAPWAAIDRTSLLRADALPTGDTNTGDAATRRELPSIDGVDGRCTTRIVRGEIIVATAAPAEVTGACKRELQTSSRRGEVRARQGAGNRRHDSGGNVLKNTTLKVPTGDAARCC
jgi:hypothetical protein